MMDIVIDSSVMVAWLNSTDSLRQNAEVLRTALDRSSFQKVYLDCVVAESVSVVARRHHEKKQPERLQELFKQLPIVAPQQAIVWTYPELPRLYPDILAMAEQTNGKLNFNDCLIALICRENNIRHIASFDRDFDQIPWLTRVSTPADLTS